MDNEIDGYINGIIKKESQNSEQEELKSFFIQVSDFYIWAKKQIPGIIEHLNKVHIFAKGLLERIGTLEKENIELKDRIKKIEDIIFKDDK